MKCPCCGGEWTPSKLMVDLTTNTAISPNGVVALSPREAELLHVLLSSNRPVSNSKIQDALYGIVDEEDHTTSIRVYVSMLRANLAKLGYGIFVTSNRGYYLTNQANYNPKRISKFNANVWTEDELRYISDHYGSVPAKQIAEVLGRTEQAVWQKARVLGLRSSNRFGRCISA